MRKVLIVLLAFICLCSPACKTVIEQPIYVMQAFNFPVLAQRIIAPTVRIRIVTKDASGWGSGVIVSRKDNQYYVVTAAHIAQPGYQLYIQTPFIATDFAAEIVYGNADMDVAIVRFSCESPLPLATVARFAPPLLSTVFLCGHGLPQGCFVSQGIFSNTGGLFDNRNLWLVTSHGWFGCSGGGVYDSAGRLTGICVQMQADEFRRTYLPFLIGVVPLEELNKAFSAANIVVTLGKGE